LHAPFPAIIIGAALLGLLGEKITPRYFQTNSSANVDLASNETNYAPPSFVRALKISVIWIVIWALPLIVAATFLGAQHTVVREGIFFSKAAIVTFGGAYAVLPYVSQQAVDHYHWLAPGQMMDGLGLAETTPGPLIMVLQFVGFLGGWNHPGN